MENFFLFKHLGNEQIEEKMHSFLFFFIEAMAFFFAWYTSSLLFATLSAIVISTIIYLYSNDGTLFAPLAFLYMISFSSFPSYTGVPIEVFIALGYYVFIIFLFLIKRKVHHLSFRAPIGSLGFSFLFCLVVLGISYVLHSFVEHGIYHEYGFYYYLYFVIYVFIYMLLTSTGIKGYIQSLRPMFLALNLVILFEVLVVFINKDQVYIDVGWGNKNTLIITIECFMPFIVLTERKHFFNPYSLGAWLILICDYFLILFSYSRGGMITSIFLVPLMCYLLVINFPWKKRILFTFLLIVGFIFLGFIFYLNNETIHANIDSLIERGNDVTGRDKIWYQALLFFKENPLFGGGPICLFEINDKAFGSSPYTEVMLCHNTFYTMLALGGILGVIGYILFNIQAIITSLPLKRNLRIAFIYFILFGFIHGLIDNTFLSPTYMFPVLLIFTNSDLLTSEDSIKELKLRKELKNKAA